MTVVTGKEIVRTVIFGFYASYSPERLVLRWFSDGWGGSSTGLDPVNNTSHDLRVSKWQVRTIPCLVSCSWFTTWDWNSSRKG